MWIILGSAVACGLALWHLRVTVPNLVEPTVEEVGGRGPGNQTHIRLPHHPDAYLRRRRDSSRMRGRIGLRATMGMGRVVDLVGIGDYSGHRRLCDDLLTTEVMASLRSRGWGSAPERNRPDAAATCTVAHCVCFDRGSVNRILLAHVAT